MGKDEGGGIINLYFPRIKGENVENCTKNNMIMMERKHNNLHKDNNNLIILSSVISSYCHLLIYYTYLVHTYPYHILCIMDMVYLLMLL